MHITHLGLRRFRNFSSLALELGPGPSLISGDNGNGKSNLLEAIYMLAVAKSPRSASDRELVGFGPAAEAGPGVPGQIHTAISAQVARTDAHVRVSIDLIGTDATAPDSPEESPLQKVMRVNGAPRRAADLLGEINAVLFTAQDLELAYGAPSIRRRYLDVLISQLDRRYLSSLQLYQRVLTQRNHLLRSIREGRAGPDELGPWDQRIVEDGGRVIAGRIRAMEVLSAEASSEFERLAAGPNRLEISYRTSFETARSEAQGFPGSEFAEALERTTQRDIARGHTGIGPHRDDLEILIGGADAARFASRGQVRTAVLALRLAEARYLHGARGEAPIVLLDDVLSELDPSRRELVLERVSGYDQCLLTTPEPASVPDRFRREMRRYAVRKGTVTALSGP